MFDLERAVDEWTASVHTGRCSGSAAIAELKDHLHCEIDRGRAAGLSDERAFAAAVATLGSAAALAGEQAKDRSWAARACALAARLEGGRASAGERRLLLAHGVLWATVAIAVSMLTTHGAGRAAAQNVLLVILIPSWLASERILRRALRSRARRAAR